MDSIFAFAAHFMVTSFDCFSLSYEPAVPCIVFQTLPSDLSHFQLLSTSQYAERLPVDIAILRQDAKPLSVKERMARQGETRRNEEHAPGRRSRPCAQHRTSLTNILCRLAAASLPPGAIGMMPRPHESVFITRERPSPPQTRLLCHEGRVHVCEAFCRGRRRQGPQTAAAVSRTETTRREVLPVAHRKEQRSSAVAHSQTTRDLPYKPDPLQDPVLLAHPAPLTSPPRHVIVPMLDRVGQSVLKCRHFRPCPPCPAPEPGPGRNLSPQHLPSELCSLGHVCAQVKTSKVFTMGIHLPKSSDSANRAVEPALPDDTRTM